MSIYASTYALDILGDGLERLRLVLLGGGELLRVRVLLELLEAAVALLVGVALLAAVLRDGEGREELVLLGLVERGWVGHCGIGESRGGRTLVRSGLLVSAGVAAQTVVAVLGATASAARTMANAKVHRCRADAAIAEKWVWERGCRVAILMIRTGPLGKHKDHSFMARVDTTAICIQLWKRYGALVLGDSPAIVQV